jgi:DNA-binding PadR family transcriptional regulator
LEENLNFLSRLEEIVLLAILKLKNNAYGVSIRHQIFIDSGKYWSFASIYQPLDKLKEKGFVEKRKGSSTPERGGKSKYYYQVTPQGILALQELRQMHNSFWGDVPFNIFDMSTEEE